MMPATSGTSTDDEPRGSAEEDPTQSNADAPTTEADTSAGREQAQTEEATVLDRDGRERPAFVLDLPDDPKLAELVAAFERGDFRTVREQAPKFAKEATDPELRAAYEELARRIAPDPLLKVFLGMSVALAVILVLWAYW